MQVVKFAVLAFIFASSVIGDASADPIDDSINKINEYTKILEGDASRYETVYLENAVSLVKWRIGWEQLVDLSDSIYYLDVMSAALRRLSDRIEYLEAEENNSMAAQNTVESRAVLAAAEADVSQLTTLLKSGPTILQSPCDSRWLRSLAVRVPLETMLNRVAPDVGTFPLVQVHPTLAISIVISESGDVSASPQPYTRDQVSGKDGKWAIPGIASTVSAAIVLTFSPGAYTPAAAIATFVYLVSVEIINRYDNARQAEAVRHLVAAMKRISQAQEAAYNKIDHQLMQHVDAVCELSFGPSIKAAIDRRDMQSKKLDVLVARLGRVRGLAPPREQDLGSGWDALECEIFGCDRPSAWLTKNPDQVAARLVEEIRKKWVR